LQLGAQEVSYHHLLSMVMLIGLFVEHSGLLVFS
jgi:hypothetical protein